VLVALLKEMELTGPEQLTCSEPVPAPIPPPMHHKNSSSKDIPQELSGDGARGESWLCIPSRHTGTWVGHAQASRQPWCHLHQLVATSSVILLVLRVGSAIGR